MIDLYEIDGPTEWAGPPERFSHSSLTAIETCARRWQLGRSRYGELGRFPDKPNRAAIAGEIVHRLIDELFKALALAGCPPLGSPAFVATLGSFGFRERAARLLDERRGAWREHPRTGARTLNLTTEEITNRAIQLFRQEYSGAISVEVPAGSPRAGASGAELSALEKLGALTELALVHPDLSFGGTIDLVRRDRDGVVVLDFKTGAEKPEHETQVLLYALLWWRKTGVLPVRAEVRYPRSARAIAITAARLEQIEDDLSRRIAAARGALEVAPAPARVGEHCRYCAHRAFCDEAWSIEPRLAPSAELVDVEVAVTGTPMPHGFQARLRSGRVLSVVHRGSVRATEGQRLRILDARWCADRNELVIGPLTECFRRS